MFIVSMALIFWIAMTAIFLVNNAIDCNAIYIAWTIVIVAITMICIHKDKED